MASDQLLQFDIDFLPARYREECAQRKSHVLRLIGAGFFGLLLVTCSAWQWHAEKKLDEQLELISPIHEGAHERTVQLTTLKNELAAAQDRAELLTYLRHPWPKTQLIAAVIEPLPKSIKLSELSISRHDEEPSTVILPSQRRRNEESASTEEKVSKEKLSPSQEDLRQLRAEFDPRTTIINMMGETTNVSQLHEYLGEISRHPLILKAELRSIDTGGRDSQAMRFRARIVVRAGYGQPSGPTSPLKSEAAPAAVEPSHQARQMHRLERAGS